MEVWAMLDEMLIYGGLDKMADILQTISNVISWQKQFVFWTTLHWFLSSRIDHTKLALVQIETLDCRAGAKPLFESLLTQSTS